MKQEDLLYTLIHIHGCHVSLWRDGNGGCWVRARKKSKHIPACMKDDPDVWHWSGTWEMCAITWLLALDYVLKVVEADNK